MSLLRKLSPSSDNKSLKIYIRLNKLKPLLITFAVAIIAVIILLSITSPFFKQGISKNILKDVRSIKKEVEEIRKLTFKKEPNVIIVNKEWVLKQWGPSTRIGEIRLWEDIYKLTLLIPPEYNLTKSMEVFTVSWIAASAGDNIYIIKENFLNAGENARRVIAHELMHILQGQYFQFPTPKYLDERLARSALIEGDADLVADTYALKHNLKISKITSIPLSDPPLAIEYFPYVYGERFIKKLYEKGGWALVNKAYVNLPESTEQIIFPEKFMAGERPKNVTLRLRKEYEILHIDRMGPFYIYVLVASSFKKVPINYIEGWTGDVLILAENSTHKVLMWKTLWDYVIDAIKFYEALKNIALSRGANCTDNICIMGDFTFIMKLDNREVLLLAAKKRQSLFN